VKCNRKKEGGRKSFFEKNPEANEAFLLILKEHTAGSPMNEGVKWTDLIHEEIKGYLLEKGFSISIKTVKKLLKNNGYVKRKALKKKPLVSL